MADQNRVDPPGKFTTHRDLVGAPAVDPGVLSDGNFPPANALHCTGVANLLAYYDDNADGSGTIDVVPLLRDGTNGVWLPQPVVQLAGRTAKIIPVHGANQVFLRINAIAGAGNNVKIRAAAAAFTDR